NESPNEQITDLSERYADHTLLMKIKNYKMLDKIEKWFQNQDKNNKLLCRCLFFFISLLTMRISSLSCLNCMSRTDLGGYILNLILPFVCLTFKFTYLIPFSANITKKLDYFYSFFTIILSIIFNFAIFDLDHHNIDFISETFFCWCCLLICIFNSSI